MLAFCASDFNHGGAPGITERSLRGIAVRHHSKNYSRTFGPLKQDNFGTLLELSSYWLRTVSCDAYAHRRKADSS